MFRRLMMVAIVLASTCTPNRTPLYAQGSPVETVQVSRDVGERWNASSGFWAECLFPTLRNDTVFVNESIPVEVVQDGPAHSPKCGHGPGFVQPSTNSVCGLTNAERDAWKASSDVIRIVYCGHALYHWYTQPRKEPTPEVAPLPGRVS